MSHEMGYTVKHDCSKHSYNEFQHTAKSVLFSLYSLKLFIKPVWNMKSMISSMYTDNESKLFVPGTLL